MYCGIKLAEKFDKIVGMDNNQSPFVSAYLRFLQLAKVVQALPDGQAIDANESALLQSVVLRWYENQPMSVREAIGLAELGSPATLHKRITRQIPDSHSAHPGLLPASGPLHAASAPKPDHMINSVRDGFETTALTLISAVLFVGFFHLNDLIFSIFEYSDGISWVFLPAGFRVILVLIMGLPGALGLMLGSWFIDRELFTQNAAALAFLNGIVGGLTPWLVLKLLIHRQWLDPKLQSLNALLLLKMTLIFAATTALMHQLVWLVLDRPHLNIWVDIWPMFMGDALGTLLMLYGFKFMLDRMGTRPSLRSH